MKSFFSPSMKTRGQGLVEYAIILSLVAIVVIAVLKLMGPKVGNTYSSINNSLAADVGAEVDAGDAPEDQAGWTFAANENGVVSVPAGVYQIQYGATGQYFYQTFTGPTTVNCNNATFGDPNLGAAKSCSLMKQN